MIRSDKRSGILASEFRWVDFKEYLAELYDYSDTSTLEGLELRDKLRELMLFISEKKVYKELDKIYNF